MYIVKLDGTVILKTDDAMAATLSYEYAKTLGNAQLEIV